MSLILSVLSKMYFHLSIYVFIWRREKEFFFCFTPQMPTAAKAGLKPRVGHSSPSDRNPSAPAVSYNLLLSRAHLSRNLESGVQARFELRHSTMECEPPTWQLYHCATHLCQTVHFLTCKKSNGTCHEIVRIK